MKPKNVELAVAEAKRFIERATTALSHTHVVGSTNPITYLTSDIDNAATKRASLDLTRALAKMRRES